MGPNGGLAVLSPCGGLWRVGSVWTGYFTFLGCGFHLSMRTEHLPPAAWGVGKNLGSSGKGPLRLLRGDGFSSFLSESRRQRERGMGGGGKGGGEKGTGEKANGERKCRLNVDWGESGLPGKRGLNSSWATD